MSARFLILVLLSLICARSGRADCTTEQVDDVIEDIYVDKVRGISLAANILSVAGIIAVALPLCCSKCEDKSKLIAGIVITVGIIAALIPLFASLGSCSEVVDDLCTVCGDDCDEDDKDDAHQHCLTWSPVVTYGFLYGWVVAIIGGVAAGMACCIFCGCKCCGDSQPKGIDAGAGPVVVGNPVQAAAA